MWYEARPTRCTRTSTSSRATAALHGDPGRRPHLQDGLRADAAAARRPGRRRDGGLPRGAAHGGDRLRRDACRRAGPHRLDSSRSRPIRRHSRQARHGAGLDGHLRLRDALPVRAAAPRRRDAGLEPRFRQGHHPLRRQARQGRGAPLQRVLRALGRGIEAYWRDVGTIDAYWEANIDLTDVVPRSTCTTRLADLDLCRDHAAGQVRARRGRRRGSRVNSLVSGGCIVSGGELRRTLLFTGVRVHSYAHSTKR
jgi:hypothetical protein